MISVYDPLFEHQGEASSEAVLADLHGPKSVFQLWTYQQQKAWTLIHHEGISFRRYV